MAKQLKRQIGYDLESVYSKLQIEKMYLDQGLSEDDASRNAEVVHKEIRAMQEEDSREWKKYFTISDPINEEYPMPITDVNFIEITKDLPEDLRIVMELRMEGFTQEEIGRRFEVSKQAINKKLIKIRRFLKNRLTNGF